LPAVEDRLAEIASVGPDRTGPNGPDGALGSDPRLEPGDRPNSKGRPEGELPPGPNLPAWVQAFLVSVSPKYLQRLQRRYGDRIRVRMGRFGTIVYLTDPEDIRTVFRGDPAVYHAGEANGLILEPVLGPSSVLVTDEDLHLRQRRLMTPPFHGQAVARLADTMREITSADVDEWPIGRAFPAIERMRRITFEVILRTVIGVRDPERLAEFRRTLPLVADLDNLMMLQFVFPGLRDRWPWRRFRRLEGRVDDLLCSEIERCRADPELDERPDVLAMLVRARYPDGAAMTTAELRDQIMTLLMAGHETTATGLAWALERLVRNPDVLSRAVQAAVDGDQTYLDAVVAETLRSRPVVADVSRRLTRPVDLGGGVVPAAVFVNPSIALVHHDARHYPDPGRFRPDRFSGRHPDPVVWLPFGGGNRRCLGATFATTEMRVVLGEVLRRVELAATTGRAERPRLRHVTYVPHAGARVTVVRRHPATSAAGP
jgi:cytochrome P450